MIKRYRVFWFTENIKERSGLNDVRAYLSWDPYKILTILASSIFPNDSTCNEQSIITGSSLSSLQKNKKTKTKQKS